MKHKSTVSFQSQIGSQLSGQQQVKAIQSDQKHKHRQARFWPPYFGIRKVFCSSITLRKERSMLCLKEEIGKKTTTHEEEKKCSFTKTMPNVTSQLQ